MRKRHNKYRTAFNILAVLFAAGIIYYTLGDTYRHIIRQLLAASKLGTMLLVLLEIVFIFLDGATLTLMVKHYKHDYPYKEGIKTLLYGNFYKGITFGSGTTVAETVLLNNEGINPGVAVSALTLQYTFYRLGIIVSTLFMLFLTLPVSLKWIKTYWLYLILAVLLSLTATAGLLLMCIWKRCHQAVLWLICKGLCTLGQDKYYEKAAIFLCDLRRESQIFLRDPVWCVKMVLLNVVKVCFWYVIPYAAYWSLAGKVPQNADILEVMALAAMVQLMVGVIPVPVGMGSTEVFYLMFFTSIFGEITAGSSMIIYRLVTYYLPFFIGTVYAGADHLRSRPFEKISN